MIKGQKNWFSPAAMTNSISSRWKSSTTFASGWSVLAHTSGLRWIHLKELLFQSWNVAFISIFPVALHDNKRRRLSNLSTISGGWYACLTLSTFGYSKISHVITSYCCFHSVIRVSLETLSHPRWDQLMRCPCFLFPGHHHPSDSSLSRETLMFLTQCN